MGQTFCIEIQSSDAYRVKLYPFYSLALTGKFINLPTTGQCFTNELITDNQIYNQLFFINYHLINTGKTF